MSKTEDEKKRDEKIREIAKGCLNIDYLVPLSVDAPRMSLGDLLQALQLVYKAGQDSKE